MIHSFCDTHPELSFSLKEVEDEELLSGLEKDFFNLIFVRKHMIDPELYTFHALTADRLVAVFPEAHPSASKKSVSLSELKKESFILMPPHTSIYRFCMQSFHNAGIHPQLFLRTARAGIYCQRSGNWRRDQSSYRKQLSVLSSAFACCCPG